MSAEHDKVWVEHSLLVRYVRDIEADVNRHKWFQSEKAGHDIGWEAALVDWNLRVAGRYFRNHPVELFSR